MSEQPLYKIFGTTLKDFDMATNEYDNELMTIALELESAYFTRSLKISGPGGRP